LPSGEKKGYPSAHLFRNLHIGFFEGIKKGKPEEATSGFQESSANNRKLKQLNYFYHGFWLFARSEAILFCFWLRFVAPGVVQGSTCVGAAGGGRLIVVRSVVF